MERVRDHLCSENPAPRPALGWVRIGQNLREEAGGKRSGLEQWSPGHGAWLPVVQESMDVRKDVYLMHKKLGISRLNT